TLICDLLHTENAQSLSAYEKDFYAGMPALTRNNFGKGAAYYVATRSNADFYRQFIGDICKEISIEPIINTPEDIEVTKRSNDNGTFLFFLNHGEEKSDIVLNCGGTDILTDNVYQNGDTLAMKAKGVAILRQK
ncbi:MAG: beta-galactosidase trimerization domain-containing protein, partial [Lachnospiraceae bacterium]|nr:beta-galactosidase trimerization domain-containing protein [Lachnospiraceae bacterium]